MTISMCLGVLSLVGLPFVAVGLVHYRCLSMFWAGLTLTSAIIGLNAGKNLFEVSILLVGLALLDFLVAHYFNCWDERRRRCWQRSIAGCTIPLVIGWILIQGWFC